MARSDKVGREGTPRELIQLLKPIRQRLENTLEYPDPTLRFATVGRMIARLPLWAQSDAEDLLRREMAKHPIPARPMDVAPCDALPIRLSPSGGFIVTLRTGREVEVEGNAGAVAHLTLLLRQAQTSQPEARRVALENRDAEIAKWAGMPTKVPARGAKKLELTMADILEDL